MRTVVSLPVHENAEVVRGQLRNILYFLQDPIIVLHVSADFDVDVNSLIVSDRVMINPERLSTAWGTGILVRVHLSNVRYALNQSNCDYIAFHSSNDLFVREGVEQYMVNQPAGLSAGELNESWLWYQRCLDDAPLHRYVRRVGLPSAMVAQIEGTFYRRDVIEQMLQSLQTLEQSVSWHRLSQGLEISRARWPFKPHVPYPREEVYFPTAYSACRIRERVPPYVYSNSRRSLKVTIDDVEAVRAHEYVALPDFEVPPGGQLFAVKRVLRHTDDPVRLHINKLASQA